MTSQNFFNNLEDFNKTELSNLELFEYVNTSGDGFMFHFKTLEKITLDSISMISTSFTTPPKIFLCENWKESTPKDKWKELTPTEVTLADRSDVYLDIIIASFKGLVLPKGFNASVLILLPNIYFLPVDLVKKEKLIFQTKNEQILMKDYGRVMEEFEIRSFVNYYFIGSIQTCLFKKIYINLYQMSINKNIYFNFE